MAIANAQKRVDLSEYRQMASIGDLPYNELPEPVKKGVITGWGKYLKNAADKIRAHDVQGVADSAQGLAQGGTTRATAVSNMELAVRYSPDKLGVAALDRLSTIQDMTSDEAKMLSNTVFTAMGGRNESLAKRATVVAARMMKAESTLFSYGGSRMVDNLYQGGSGLAGVTAVQMMHNPQTMDQLADYITTPHDNFPLKNQVAVLAAVDKMTSPDISSSTDSLSESYVENVVEPMEETRKRKTDMLSGIQTYGVTRILLEKRDDAVAQVQRIIDKPEQAAGMSHRLTDEAGFKSAAGGVFAAIADTETTNRFDFKPVVDMLQRYSQHTVDEPKVRVNGWVTAALVADFANAKTGVFRQLEGGIKDDFVGALSANISKDPIMREGGRVDTINFDPWTVLNAMDPKQLTQEQRQLLRSSATHAINNASRIIESEPLSSASDRDRRVMDIFKAVSRFEEPQPDQAFHSALTAYADAAEKFKLPEITKHDELLGGRSYSVHERSMESNINRQSPREIREYIEQKLELVGQHT